MNEPTCAKQSDVGKDRLQDHLLSLEFLCDLKVLADKYGMVVGGGGNFRDRVVKVVFRKKPEKESQP